MVSSFALWCPHVTSDDLVRPLFACFSAQEQTVTLPEGVECLDCSIRLVRQANEWGGRYNFWSCADVDIVGK